MPRSPDPTVRARLVEVAADLLATGEDVSLRRVAAEAGTSTMAVYTYFDGMPGLWLAVREQAFAHLAEQLDSLAPTEDPVADLVALGRAFADTALARPSLYTAMFDVRRSGQPRDRAHDLRGARGRGGAGRGGGSPATGTDARPSPPGCGA